MTTLLIAIGVVVLTFVFLYNGLVTKQYAVKAGFSNMDVELKRRFDLIPNLVETAKKYMSHESGTLSAVVAARSGAISALESLRNNPNDEKAITQMREAEHNVNQTLYSFKAVAESYPQLKADGIVTNLMTELTDTENRIAFMRQNYNDLVMNYNSALEVFPTVFVARAFNFKAATSWQIERAAEREAVRVTF
jgi:LemA protein